MGTAADLAIIITAGRVCGLLFFASVGMLPDPAYLREDFFNPRHP
jgi:hypothetical protein